MAKQKVKIIFGGPQPGCARIFIGDRELQNVASMQFSNMLPGQLPLVTFQLHAPDLQVEGELDTEITTTDFSEEE